MLSARTLYSVHNIMNVTAMMANYAHQVWKSTLFPIVYYIMCGPGSSVGRETELRAGWSGIESREDEDFPHLNRPVLEPTQPTVKWIPSLSRGKVRPERSSDQSHSSSATVMEEYSYTSTHHVGHTGPVTGSLYLYFHLFIL